MSEPAIFYEILDTLSRQRFPEVSEEDLLAVLKATRPGPLAFLSEAGAEAGLPRQQLFARAAAIYFNFCAGNLADDLMDGECTYLSDPFRLGPCVQYILQTLCFRTLVEAEVSGPIIIMATQELLQAAGQQLVEVRTVQWTAPVFREVAEGIAGRQWAAYMHILWSDSPLANRAATIGMNAGIAAHVVKDIQSQDLRYTTMPEADKRKIVAWAMAAADALREEHLRCLDALLLTIDPTLQEAS